MKNITRKKVIIGIIGLLIVVILCIPLPRKCVFGYSGDIGTGGYCYLILEKEYWNQENLDALDRLPNIYVNESFGSIAWHLFTYVYLSLFTTTVHPSYPTDFSLDSLSRGGG